MKQNRHCFCPSCFQGKQHVFPLWSLYSCRYPACFPLHSLRAVVFCSSAEEILLELGTAGLWSPGPKTAPRPQQLGTLLPPKSPAPQTPRMTPGSLFPMTPQDDSHTLSTGSCVLPSQAPPSLLVCTSRTKSPGSPSALFLPDSSPECALGTPE